MIEVIGWLHALPDQVIYITVLLVVGIESLGVPLPGEITLMSAALLASHGAVSPWGVWAAGSVGAITGDSIGYLLGHTFGDNLLHLLGRLFPRHVNDRTTGAARVFFRRYGAKTVFFGRFIALLRIFAGPLSGILKMQYRKFLLANASGGIVWSGLAVWSVYFLGVVAEHWFRRFSWIALVVALLVGTVLTIIFRQRIEDFIDRHADEPPKA